MRTFNEGREITPTKTEQHVIAPNDGKPIAIAVIWECWGEAGPAMLASFAMVTVPANALIRQITDRMPAIVAAEKWDVWLGETAATVAELKAFLRPFEGDWTMQAQARHVPAAPQKRDPTELSLGRLSRFGTDLLAPDLNGTEVEAPHVS